MIKHTSDASSSKAKRITLNQTHEQIKNLCAMTSGEYSFAILVKIKRYYLYLKGGCKGQSAGRKINKK